MHYGSQLQRSPLDHPNGTARLAVRLALEGSRHPVVFRAADAAVRGAPENATAEIRRVVRWLRRNIRVQRDPVRPLGGEADELLQSPHVTIARRAGDCLSWSVLAAAMLGWLGIPTRLVGMSIDEGDPHHMYIEAWDRRLRRWVAVDAWARELRVGRALRSRRRTYWSVGGEDMFVMRERPGRGAGTGPGRGRYPRLRGTRAFAPPGGGRGMAWRAQGYGATAPGGMTGALTWLQSAAGIVGTGRGIYETVTREPGTVPRTTEIESLRRAQAAAARPGLGGILPLVGIGLAAILLLK